MNVSTVDIAIISVPHTLLPIFKSVKEILKEIIVRNWFITINKVLMVNGCSPQFTFHIETTTEIAESHYS